MRLIRGTYGSDNSDLEMIIIKVRYQSDVYVKVKAILVNKNNGIVYDRKNYNLIKEQIKHWKLR